MSFAAFLSPEEIADLQAEEAASDKAQKRTPEQIQAIYSHGQNILVSASAGSGKTFVMVERILDQIQRGVGVDQLFISTFTVKAAGELRERLEKKLTEALTKTQDEALRQHLSKQLTDLPKADIGTMDAFTQKLVNTYGYRRGISPNFRIMQDKHEQDLLKNEVFAQLFDRYMTGKSAETFVALVRNFSGHSKTSKAFQGIVDQIYQFSQATAHPKQWLQENLLRGYQTYQDLSAWPDVLIQQLAAELKETAEQLRDLTDHPDYKQVTAKGQPTKTYEKHLAIIEGLKKAKLSLDLGQDKAKLSEMARQLLASLPKGDSVTVAGVKHPIFKSLQASLRDLQYLDKILDYQVQAQPLLKLLQQFVLDFSAAYLAAKHKESAYEFSDIGHFAIEILENEPKIRDFFVNKYHEVMVDEYQDNNHTQERMLDLLSNGHNRFMVGDIKQSIYRFRQADPQIFQAKFDLYRDNSQAGQLILLKENFRSQKEVIDATNSVFTRLMDAQVGQINYDQTHTLVAGSERQRIDQPAHQAEFLIYDTSSAASESEGEEKTELTAGEVQLVAKEIIRLHNEEGVAFEDITLLVPSRTRNHLILNTFSQHGIPLVADGGEASYLQSVEVMVMLDTLRCLNNPLNDYALVALLKSPMFNFTEDELARVSLQLPANLSEQATPQLNFYEKLQLVLTGKNSGAPSQLITPQLYQKLSAFESVFGAWRSYAQKHKIYDLIWRIYNDKFYYDYVGALSQGEKRQANLYALALRAHQFEKTGYKGLSRFIGMIDKILANQNDLADVAVALPQDAVQLMTIHKSKGLEFKYVFLLNMDKAFNQMESRSPIVLSRDQGVGIQYLADVKGEFPDKTSLPHVRVMMETLPYTLNQRALKLAALSEQMRLLYVAMTRAEVKLYLVGKGEKDKLTRQFDGRKEAGKLPVRLRSQLTSFQDWFLALDAAFSEKGLAVKLTFVEDQDLTPEKIGRLVIPSVIDPTAVKDLRQTDELTAALNQLRQVTQLNQNYEAAIHLPAVRTPSQIKKFYEPVMDQEGVVVLDEADRDSQPTQQRLDAPFLDHAAPVPKFPDFSLPDFSKKKRVTGAEIGAAVHELMQRLPLAATITALDVASALAQVDSDEAVKTKIQVDKLVAFFQTDLGQEILCQRHRVKREAPFAMLMRDDEAQADFVVRGIVDGYILYDDRIVLFDYKTDRYQQPQELVQRYRTQMALYARALSQAYGIAQVQPYLILLGGDEVEVVLVPRD